MEDVVIAGAGPNGLLLACELALAGVRPLVVEPRLEPSSEPRANGLVGQVVRVLDQRGLYERLTGSTEPPRPQPGFVFGALTLDLHAVPENPMHLLPVPQRRLEQVLGERAAELGVRVRRGAAVIGLDQGDDAVTVHLSDGSALTARYLVGADGGHSAVRKLAGIAFPGVTNDSSVSRTCSVSVPAQYLDPETGGLAVPGYGLVPPFRHTRTEHGMIVWAPFPGRTPSLTTVEWTDTPATDGEPTLDELRSSVTRVLGAALPIDPPDGDGPHLMRRRAGGNTRLAERYRSGRVLLLGDAAHVHSAIGGPGLNLGLQDALNLGWKLARVVRGTAPDALLDSYEAERRPVAQRVTMSTQAQSALIARGSDVTALRVLFAELLALPAVAGHVAALMAGSDIWYEDAEAPVGRFAPDVVVTREGGPVRLAELLRPARPVLVDLSGTLTRGPWQDRVDVVTGTASAPWTALLVRPDGYVAWASTAPSPDTASLEAAVCQWFGSPVAA